MGLILQVLVCYFFLRFFFLLPTVGAKNGIAMARVGTIESAAAIISLL